MPSKMSDARLLTSYTRAKAERGRVDNRVTKAQATLDNLEQLKADATETIATADASKAELDAQLEHLRTIARNRNVDLDAATAPDGEPAKADEGGAEEPPVQVDGEPVAQPAPGAPAFSQGY